MPAYDWKGQVSLAQPRINPNQAFASAANAFKGMGDQIQNIEKTRLLAGIEQQKLADDQQRLLLQQRQQDWTEGAPEREQKALLSKQQGEAEKALLIENYRKAAGLAGIDQFFKNPEIQQKLQAVPGWANMTPEQRNEYTTQYAMENLGQFADPNEFADMFRTNLVHSGKFNNDEIEKITQTEVSRLYPSLDVNTVKSLASIYKTTSGSSGGNRGSSTKPDRKDYWKASEFKAAADNLVEEFSMPKKSATLLGGLAGYRVTKQGVKRAMSQLKQMGVRTPEAAAAALRTKIESGWWGNGDSDLDFRNLTPDQLEELKNEALAAEAYIHNAPGTTGSGGGNGNAQATQMVDGLLSRMSPQAATQDEILSQFVQGFGGTYQIMSSPNGTKVVAPNKQLLSKETKTTQRAPDAEKPKKISNPYRDRKNNLTKREQETKDDLLRMLNQQQIQQPIQMQNIGQYADPVTGILINSADSIGNAILDPIEKAKALQKHYSIQGNPILSGNR